jgi:hypothetical protein
MSKDDRQVVADVRRELWSQGLRGLATGSVTGLLLHTVAATGNHRKWWKLGTTNRNTAFASFLLGGAIGSFLSASTAGKNEVHKMHPVFQAGAKDTAAGSSASGGGSSYQESLQRAKEREKSLRVLERRRSNRELTDAEDSRVQRERNRLYRRATLTRSMEAGQGGLSDSHGGHWYTEEEKKKNAEKNGK